MNEYAMTIGLEIHAELKTKSKMFCGCVNAPHAQDPNIYVCPVCMGHPGTLPVINKEAVHKVLLVGTAVGANLADFTEFDRKNYFYPDIPKGYQISQYKYPLVSGGTLAGVALTRIHLEEDTARSSHDTPGVSLVDFNRAGVPLMELVTEPVIRSAAQAMAFAKELQLLLQYIGASDANMEKGEMRVEVNISVSKGTFDTTNGTDSLGKSDSPDLSKLGTKVEVKNINSFRAAGKAIEYEYARQVALLEKGEKVVQETRGWDENRGATVSQRSKEDAHDYRYFPDPDLPKLLISEIPEFAREALSASLPELPWQKRERLAKDFGLKAEDIEMYVTDAEAGEFFQSAARRVSPLGADAVTILSNYITSDLVGLSKASGGDGSFSHGMATAESLAELIGMIKSGDLSSRGAKDALKIMFESGGDPRRIAEEKGLMQKSDEGELKTIVAGIISANQKTVEEYKAGKESVFQFFVGQAMKATKGSANPEVLKKIILEMLKKNDQ
jgi:aspartyl-tRNA(Asn)/glutamyl-tRNA(Gln) amidotransferase subunit B